VYCSACSTRLHHLLQVHGGAHAKTVGPVLVAAKEKRLRNASRGGHQGWIVRVPGSVFLVTKAWVAPLFSVAAGKTQRGGAPCLEDVRGTPAAPGPCRSAAPGDRERLLGGSRPHGFSAVFGDGEVLVAFAEAHQVGLNGSYRLAFAFPPPTHFRTYPAAMMHRLPATFTSAHCGGLLAAGFVSG